MTDVRRDEGNARVAVQWDDEERPRAREPKDAAPPPPVDDDAHDADEPPSPRARLRLR